jgi:hypothetical protein
MSKSLNHTEVSVHYCYGKHTVASSQTLLVDLVLLACLLCPTLCVYVYAYVNTL